MLLLAAWMLLATMSRADTQAELVEKYCKAFNFPDNDGMSRQSVVFAMDKEVPRAGRDDFYAALIDRAASEPDGAGAIGYVLGELGNREVTFIWNQHLKRSVLAQAKHKSAGVRGMVSSLLCMHDRTEYRDLCLSYLNDPDDDVRSKTLFAMGRWPDALSIMTKYIQDHHASSDHSGSLEVARGYVDGTPPAQ